MAITQLEQKQNRKLWVPIRDGNRGGWSLFNWQDVRQMPYKDREMYLGNSVTIGVLDKGGKWRKRDWYLKTNKMYKSDQLTNEQQQAIKKDYERMNAALGIADVEDEEKLTEQEMRQLMKKIQMKKQGYEEPSLPDAIGLGFDKTKVQIRAKPSTKTQNPHKLQAFDEIDEEKVEKKQKKQKKVKKEKKQKKKKHKENKHRHRDDSVEKQKKKDQKHHKKGKSEKEERRRDRSRSEEKHRRRRHSSSQSSN